jgi:glycine oxidase
VALGDDPPLSAGVVVLATGAWTAHLVTDPALRLPVRPVKGQTLRLHGSPDLLRHVLRGSVRGFPVYLVPRGDGELVVGATSEETGYDVSHRAGAVLDLLRHAQALLPDLAETAVLELSTSLRPATPDNAPVIGTTGVDGVVAAVGHYRNGVLLAPVTADIVAAMVVDGVTPAEALPFGADRFAVGAAT